jgi:hypothetical protein
MFAPTSHIICPWPAIMIKFWLPISPSTPIPIHSEFSEPLMVSKMILVYKVANDFPFQCSMDAPYEQCGRLSLHSYWTQLLRAQWDSRCPDWSTGILSCQGLLGCHKATDNRNIQQGLALYFSVTSIRAPFRSLFIRN